MSTRWTRWRCSCGAATGFFANVSSTSRRRPDGRQGLMDASSPPAIDETSRQYPGWRVVAACFMVASFSWGIGFYGQSVFLAELHRLHGWPTSLISTATTFFYVFGAGLVVFISDAMRRFGARACLLVGVACMATATLALGHIDRPWQLYAV